MKQGKYDGAIEVAKRYLNDEVIQSQLITAYMKQGKYDEAIKIAKQHPNYEPIQNQLITLYMEQEKYDKIDEIIERSSDNNEIQGESIEISKLVTRYIENRFQLENADCILPNCLKEDLCMEQH